jgi:hypothetical protein
MPDVDSLIRAAAAGELVWDREAGAYRIGDKEIGSFITKAWQAPSKIGFAPHVDGDRIIRVVLTSAGRARLDELEAIDRAGVTAEMVNEIYSRIDFVQHDDSGIREGLTAVLAMPHPHTPCRGSDVEAWLKRKRDGWPQGGGDYGNGGWAAVDMLLDDYRLHADTGVPLGDEVMGPTDD